MFAVNENVIRRAFALAAIVALSVALGRPARLLAADQKPGDAVESGREALNGRTTYPWYDAAQDDLKRVPVKSDQVTDASNRKTNWEIGDIPSPNASLPAWSFWSGLGQVLKVLFYLVILAIIVLLVTLLVRAFLNRESSAAVASRSAEDDEEFEGEVDRVDQLPFDVKRPRSDLLSEARRLYEAGNFAQAIIYLFSYELVQLDKHQFIRLTRGKTNRQYVREVRARPPLQGLLAQTMVAFEDVFFGHHGLDRARFEACWNRLDDFHQHLQQVPA